ncbi:hypothetical protein Lser_V15G38819 [Lactuca serriola]
MFDALSHQRLDDIDDDSRVPPIIDDDSCVPPVIHSRDIYPVSDELPNSSHGGRISSPIDQG